MILDRGELISVLGSDGVAVALHRMAAHNVSAEALADAILDAEKMIKRAVPDVFRLLEVQRERLIEAAVAAGMEITGSGVGILGGGPGCDFSYNDPESMVAFWVEIKATGWADGEDREVEGAGDEQAASSESG